MGGGTARSFDNLEYDWCFFIESRGVVVARVMSGLFMTSLEMAGVSLTLMRADKETLRLIGKCSNT